VAGPGVDGAPSQAPRSGAPPGARRAGYLVAIVVNVALLYAVPRLYDWGWPAFLTPAYDDVVPLLAASLGASLAANAVYLLHDGARTKALGDLVTSLVGLAAVLRTWEVYPFDFRDYGDGWSLAARSVLALAMVGSAIGALAALARLLRGRRER
jgi:hypothetical protein